MSNLRHGKIKHKLYETWTNMKTRCHNEKASSYQYCGGRGIEVCVEWDSDFMAFFNFSINNGWREGLELDRIDTNGNYSPINCRFVTSSINSSTRRKRTDNKTGFIGVGWHKHSKHFVARITVKKEVIRIGCYKTALDACRARDMYIIKRGLPHTLNSL